MQEDKLSHLEQVKADARRITQRRIDEAKAEREFQEGKNEETFTSDELAETQEVKAPKTSKAPKKKGK